MSYVPTSPFISESVITSGPSPILTERLCAPYESALYIKLTTLNLILNCPGLKLAIAVHGGLPTGRPLLCVPCVPCVPIRSNDATRRYFWPVETWDGLILKVGNAGKAPASPWFIACCFHLYDLVSNYSCSC